jgi:hypothetical protein
MLWPSNEYPCGSFEDSHRPQVILGGKCAIDPLAVIELFNSSSVMMKNYAVHAVSCFAEVGCVKVGCQSTQGSG